MLHASSTTYDAFGNQVSQTSPLHETTTNAYDLDGNLVSTTDPMSNVTAYTYDAYGNQISQSLPDPANGQQVAGSSPTTTYTYDADGNMLSLTDPDNYTTSWTYDALGDETWRRRGQTGTMHFRACGETRAMVIFSHATSAAHRFS